jgi:signal transduction histidine kinase/DNA-binding response OmpR family regulator/streptogramin lyase
VESTITRLNILHFDPASGVFKHFASDGKPGSIAYQNVHGLLADNDKLWVGTFTQGLNVIDLKTQKVIRHYKKSEKPGSLCDNSVFSIYKDHSRRLWIGTIRGLDTYNPEQDNFTHAAYPGNAFIYDIFESYDGMMWFASFGDGAFRYNPRNGERKVFKHDPDNPNSLGYNKIISTFEDSGKRLWFTTEGGGISRYNPESDNFTTFTTDDGLPNNVVYKMLEDNNQRLWFTTNNGLCRFHPAGKSIKTYTLSDGLTGNQFNYKSGYKMPDGQLYFGCLNGFVSFHPASFTENNFIPPILITDFQLFNKEVKQSVNIADEIRLRHNQSSFSVGFSALSYTAPEKNNYAYILEGFEDEWTLLSGKYGVTYSNIPPGNYTFRVKGSNSNGVWNETPAVLKIRVLHPFYKTTAAYIFYSLCLLTFVLIGVVYYHKQLKRRNKRRLELFENEKNKELYNAKIAFFTNIAHEIRTPLSLIKGPVEQLRKREMTRTEMDEDLSVIERNTNRLLYLTNQLLDFRKIEANGFQLNYLPTDVKQLINEIYIRFKPTALQKNLSFEFKTPSELLWADVDREVFTKIISNLFTNAIKYSHSNIEFDLETIAAETGSDEKEMYFRIKVINDGNPIPDELKEKIFEPFYRINDENGNNMKSGAGLGLPLARSLVELHHGKLYLETSAFKQNTFVLELPLKQNVSIAIGEAGKEDEKPVYQENKTIPKTKATVLIVEDDREMRHFLYNKLKVHYHAMKASNGKAALICLQNENIDIVVTDVMMPEMDGLQLCSEIKSNVDYSHIPVIMLTAKTDIKSRIEGLEMGADAYVEKPFSMELLLVQISNLFANRSKIKQAFINSPNQNIGSIATTKADEIFLEKVTRIIYKNLSNTSFSIDVLAEELHTSRSNLHRKIKSISELTPNDFIQLIRLKKAAELLQENTYRINEISYLVGFRSSSYFSKSFKKQFGISPKELVENKEADAVGQEEKG